jgi:response regulator RpfG family c-di-GMP phosphodiesterase
VPLAATVAELQRCAGSQFDPRVVEAFVAAVDDGAIDPAAIAESATLGRGW